MPGLPGGPEVMWTAPVHSSRPEICGDTRSTREARPGHALQRVTNQFLTDSVGRPTGRGHRSEDCTSLEVFHSILL
jgi:hypothetical protein